MIRRGVLVLILALIAWPTLAAAESTRVFDGSDREVLYRTSSHAGERQLQILLRMIPGGEQLRVLKMPYKWKNEPERLAAYPVVIQRMGNHFDAPFSRGDDRVTSLDQVDPIATQHALIDQRVADLQSTGAEVLVLVTGHYNERKPGVGEGMMLASAIFQQWDDTRDQPGVYMANTIEACRDAYPASVRTDLFHASGTANWLEGLAIIERLCAHDGIPVPPAVAAHVEAEVAAATIAMAQIAITWPDLSLDSDTSLVPGDRISVTWQADPAEVEAVHVMLHHIAGSDYYLAESVPATATGRFDWTVVQSLPRAGNNLGRLPGLARAEVVTVPHRRDRRQPNRYCFRIVSAEDPSKTYAFSQNFRIEFNAEPRTTPATLSP